MARIKSDALKDLETQSPMRIPESAYLILTACLFAVVIFGLIYLS